MNKQINNKFIYQSKSTVHIMRTYSLISSLIMYFPPPRLLFSLPFSFTNCSALVLTPQIGLDVLHYSEFIGNEKTNTQ